MIRKRKRKARRKVYEKSFKEEAIKLSDQIGVKKQRHSWGYHTNTLSGWRNNREKYGCNAFCGSGHKRLPVDPAEQRIQFPQLCPYVNHGSEPKDDQPAAFVRKFVLNFLRRVVGIAYGMLRCPHFWELLDHDDL